MRLRIADWECEGRVYAGVRGACLSLAASAHAAWLASSDDQAPRGGIERLLRKSIYTPKGCIGLAVS